MRNYFNTQNTKERRLLHFATGPSSSPTPDPDKKPEQKEGADKAKMEELNTALEGVDQEGKLTKNATTLAKMEIEETKNGQNESLADLETGLRDIAQLQYDDIIDSGKSSEEAVKQLNEDFAKTGRTFTVDDKGSVELALVAKKPEQKEKKDDKEKGSEKVTEDLKEIFKQLVAQLNELLGKLKPKEATTKSSDKPKDVAETKEVAGKDPKEMKTSEIDKELGDVDKAEQDFDKQLDDLPDVTKDNAEGIRKKISEIQAKKLELKPRKDALEAEKTRRTELIKKDWETAKKSGAKEPAITDVRIEGDDLVFDLSKGGNMETIQKIAKEAGFTILADGRLQDVPAKIYEEGGDIATARIALLTALAKVENAGAEKPEEPKKTKGPKESKEKLELADKLNQQKNELLSNAPAMKETVLGSIFDKMTYKMSPDGKNIIIDIAAGDFDKMLAIGKANRRGIKVSPDGNTVTFSGGPGGDTWSMTRGETIVMPCHKAWGGEKDNVDSQYKMAETGMNKWASTMVSKVPDTQKPLDVKGNKIDVKESAETAEAQNVSNALEDLKSSLPKGVKELPVGRFLDSLTVKDGADGKIVYLSSMKPSDGDPTQVDKEFAYFYENLFIPNTPVGVDKTTGQYAISFDKSFASSNVTELGRMKAWLTGIGPEGQGAFDRDKKGGNTVEKKEGTPKSPKEIYREKMDTMKKDAADLMKRADEMIKKIKAGEVNMSGNDLTEINDIRTALKDMAKANADLFNTVQDGDWIEDGDMELEDQLTAKEKELVAAVEADAETGGVSKPKKNVEKGKEVDPSQKKTEELMQRARDLAAEFEMGTNSVYDKIDFPAAIQAAREAISEEEAFLSSGNGDQAEVENRIAVLDQHTKDLDSYEKAYEMTPTFEEIGEELNNQFSEISNTLDGAGFEDGKDQWGPALANINILHEAAGYDYRPEITGQEFYDQGTSETYVLVENDENQYELKPKPVETQSEKPKESPEEIKGRIDRELQTIESTGNSGGESVQFGGTLDLLNEYLNENGGERLKNPDVAAYVQGKTVEFKADGRMAKKVLRYDEASKKFVVAEQNENINKAANIVKDLGSIVAKRSGLSAKERTVVRNGFSVEHTSGRYVLTIDTNMVGKGNFTPAQMNVITQGLTVDVDRAKSLPMSFKELTDYASAFVSRINTGLPKAA